MNRGITLNGIAKASETVGVGAIIVLSAAATCALIHSDAGTLAGVLLWWIASTTAASILDQPGKPACDPI